MTTIKATVRNGRIEVDEPLNLPDGTELLIPLPNGTEEGEEDRPMTPDEIARVLTAIDRVEPFVWTEEERAAWETERLARKEWEKVHFNEHADKLRRLWE
jgi:hypothetical protein